MDRAKAGAKKVNVFFSASDSFNQANLENMDEIVGELDSPLQDTDTKNVSGIRFLCLEHPMKASMSVRCWRLCLPAYGRYCSSLRHSW